jgi:hypothetical protein
VGDGNTHEALISWIHIGKVGSNQALSKQAAGEDRTFTQVPDQTGGRSSDEVCQPPKNPPTPQYRGLDRDSDDLLHHLRGNRAPVTRAVLVPKLWQLGHHRLEPLDA